MSSHSERRNCRVMDGPFLFFYRQNKVCRKLRYSSKLANSARARASTRKKKKKKNMKRKLDKEGHHDDGTGYRNCCKMIDSEGLLRLTSCPRLRRKRALYYEFLLYFIYNMKRYSNDRHQYQLSKAYNNNNNSSVRYYSSRLGKKINIELFVADETKPSDE